MQAQLQLTGTRTWEDRQIRIRDFLDRSGAGRFTPATLRLRDGSLVPGRHPRLVWLIDSLPPDADGVSPRDTQLLTVDLSPGLIGTVRLGDVEALELAE